jgi:hypothetical protein
VKSTGTSPVSAGGDVAAVAEPRSGTVNDRARAEAVISARRTWRKLIEMTPL